MTTLEPLPEVRKNSFLKTILAAAILMSIAYGFGRGPAETRYLHERMQAVQTPHLPRAVSFTELDDLPAPVQTYLRGALRDGQPIVALVRFDQVGTLNWNAANPDWRNFKAEFLVTTQRPSYDWNAQVTASGGVDMRAHNAYVGGLSTLHATRLGLFTWSLENTPERAHAGLQRFLVEAPWYPTSLLPSQGVRWKAVDPTSAIATLTEGRASASALFTFDAQGMIGSVRTQARGDASGVPAWEARYSSYTTYADMRIPLACTTGWWSDGKLQPFWLAHVKTVLYEFSP